MTTSAPLTRKFVLCLLLVATLAVAVFAGSASPQVTPGQIHQQGTDSGTGQDICTGQEGTVTGAWTFDAHFVNDPFEKFSGTFTDDYRWDWADGTYLVGHSTVHEEFQSNAAGDFEGGFAQQDRGTLYSADGEVLGHPSVFTQGHITGDFADGSVRAQVFHQRVSCP